MASKWFHLTPGRTSKQGQQVNIGKDEPEYETMVTTILMNADDMKEMNLVAGSKIRVKTEFGEDIFSCIEGKMPPGLLFVVYGPPTCKLMGGETDGTGMPLSKGWEVEVEAVS